MPATFVIAQSGGPTAVVNQTVVGAALEVRRRHPGARVLGARHGVRGIRDGDYVDLSAVPEERLRRIGMTPGAALGSTRDQPDAAYREKILAGLRGVGADAFIHVGGDGTAAMQQALVEESAGGVAFVHAPKTIDNDLVGSDHTPGFPSAAEFVAGAFAGVDLDFRSLPGIYVGIVMGRHAGFLTAASAAWRLDADSGPHLVYVPERAFSMPRFIDDVRATVARCRRCVVAVSEGIATEDGRPLVESLVPPERLERDPHGNVRLSGSDLNVALEHALAEQLPRARARVDTLGYLPRSHPAAISADDRREAFEAGAFAVEAAERGGGSVALVREGDRIVPTLARLADIAGGMRRMPADFLLPDANHLSARAKAYFDRVVPQRHVLEKPFV